MAAVKIFLKNESITRKVRRINLKWIYLNQLTWILDELFTILHGRYQPTQLCLWADFSSPAQASFFLICAEDSAGVGYRPHVMPRPDPDNLHCHRQELTLVARTLAQEAIIFSKNSNILIEIKDLSLLFFPLWKTS